MNNYLLFEVGVEELPSRFVSSTLDQIKSNLTKMFNENRIEFSDIKTYGTPRRLTFIVENISERQSNFPRIKLCIASKYSLTVFQTTFIFYVFFHRSRSA